MLDIGTRAIPLTPVEGDMPTPELHERYQFRVVQPLGGSQRLLGALHSQVVCSLHEVAIARIRERVGQGPRVAHRARQRDSLVLQRSESLRKVTEQVQR